MKCLSLHRQQGLKLRIVRVQADLFLQFYVLRFLKNINTDAPSKRASLGLNTVIVLLMKSGVPKSSISVPLWKLFCEIRNRWASTASAGAPSTLVLRAGVGAPEARHRLAHPEGVAAKP